MKNNNIDFTKALKNTLDKNINNKNILNKLNAKFKEKGLERNKIFLLFEDQIKIDNLDKFEKMAISEVLFDEIKLSILDYNNCSAFGENLIKEYEELEMKHCCNEEEELEVFFDEVKKIDDYNYLAYITLKDLTEYIENNVILYNFESQRASKYKKIGLDVVQEISLNKRAVGEMSELIKQHKYEEDMIIMNVRLIEGNEPDIEFIPKYTNSLGQLSIHPSSGEIEGHTTLIECTDGWHRIQAGIQAYKNTLLEEGHELEGGFPVKIVLRKLEQAGNIVAQTSKRSAIDKKYAEVLETNNYTDFVNMMINKSEWLRKAQIGKTFEECKVLEQLTYKSLLIDLVKRSNINVDSKLEKSKKSQIMAEIFDAIREILDDRGIDSNSVLYKPNTFIVYFTIAEILSNSNKDYFDNLMNIVDSLINNFDEEIYNSLNMNTKQVNIKNVSEYFRKNLHILIM